MISATDAYTLMDKDGRFTVEMPDKPVFEKRRMKNLEIFGGSFSDSHEWMVESKPNTAWMASYRDLESAIEAS